MIEEQPNDDAAVQHDVLAPKGHELSAVPAEVLGAIFKTTPDAFSDIFEDKERVVIAHKPGFGRSD